MSSVIYILAVALRILKECTLIYMVTFIAYVLMVTVAYFATTMGLVAPVTQNVTWVMPPVLYGFFATAFDWRAIVLSLINIGISTVVYYPFVKIADKQQEMGA